MNNNSVGTNVGNLPWVFQNGRNQTVFSVDNDRITLGRNISGSQDQVCYWTSDTLSIENGGRLLISNVVAGANLIELTTTANGFNGALGNWTWNFTAATGFVFSGTAGNVTIGPGDVGITMQEGGNSFQVTAATISINGTQILGTRKTGWAAPTGTLARTTFDQSTVTLAELAKRVAALVTDLRTHGLIGT